MDKQLQVSAYGKWKKPEMQVQNIYLQHNTKRHNEKVQPIYKVK